MHTGIRRFEQNRAGRDIAVGDIHGSYTALQKALDDIGFDPTFDRLFSVGDLVDRGTESEQVIEWLNKPWFHAVQGNHEVMTIWGIKGDSRYAVYAGEFINELSDASRKEMCEVFEALPLIIEVQTAHGVVGIVHADFPFDDWKLMPRETPINKSETSICQWSRQRIDHLYDRPIKNIRAVIHGHTPTETIVKLGNCIFIDTAGWSPEQGGHFTLLDLHTLEAAPHVIDLLD